MKLLTPPLLATLVVITGLLALPPSSPVPRWPVVSDGDAVGLRAVDCWFGKHASLPPIECYQMQVPERHDRAGSRIVSFPVMVARATSAHKPRAPLLHLGAGGPGAPMYLDSIETVHELISTLRRASIDQGRDLVVIDPRGTGLARPRLVCDEFIEGERRRFSQHLTLPQTRDSVVDDYRRCIDRYLESGVDFNAYNSFAIARDIDTLRRSIGGERWILLGISYGANYALTIADEYPATVESMALDSAYVARVDFSQRYIEWMTQPYRQLFDYCDYDPGCTSPIPRVRERFWALHQALNRKPLAVELDYDASSEPIVLLLDGERFLDAVVQGLYGVEIYQDLPLIIAELERGEYRSLEPYLWLHVDYMLDGDWGDVSEMAHHCYETRPFMDRDRIRARFPQLPPGYLRDTAEFFLDWPDHCAQMKIDDRAPRQVPSRRVTAPTLFLHGRLDSITPLADLREIEPYFDRARLITFDLGHSVLTGSRCALQSMAIFFDDPGVETARLECD